MENQQQEEQLTAEQLEARRLEMKNFSEIIKLNPGVKSTIMTLTQMFTTFPTEPVF